MTRKITPSMEAYLETIKIIKEEKKEDELIYA